MISSQLLYLLIQMRLLPLSCCTTKSSLLLLSPCTLATSQTCDLHTQVNQLYEAHKQYLSERSYFDNGIDSIRANMQWLQSNAEQVCQWLQSAS